MISVALGQATQFILEKNLLAVRRAEDLVELIDKLSGLPDEPRLTSFLAARARTINFTPKALPRALAEKWLVRAPLVRSTRYLVPAQDYPLWLAATARQRNQHFNAEFRLWGIATNAEIEQLAETVRDLLGDQALTLDEVTARLPTAVVMTLSQTSRGGQVSQTTNVELALRWLTAQGKLAVLDQSPVGRQEEAVYVRFEQSYPSVDLATLPSEAEAQKAVVQRYLATFGPATEADISFWTGFGKSETARATNALSRETTLTMVQGIPGMQLCLKGQAEALRGAQTPVESIVNVLPPDDPFVTAHRASRSRYFGEPKLQRQVFSSSGAAKPTIVVSGQIVGTWQLESDKLIWQLLTVVDPGMVSLIEAEIEQVANFLREATRAIGHK